MAVTIKPTKIKQSFYLLIPKNIADLVDINKKTKLNLNIKKSERKPVLEYCIQ